MWRGGQERGMGGKLRWREGGVGGEAREKGELYSMAAVKRTSGSNM